MSIDVFPSMLLATLQNPLPITQGGTGAITAATARTNLGLGTMSVQNADAVAITGGAISIGGHTPTGVLDVQGSVQASDLANRYFSARLWPTAPVASATLNGARIEPATGSALATAAFRGLSILDQPTMASVQAIELSIMAGTGRYNIYANGSAQNYVAGNVGIANPTPSYPLDVTGQVQASALTLGGHAPTGVLDVQSSVMASDVANFYTGARIWPVAPASAIAVHPVRIEVATGAGLATTDFRAVVVQNQPAMAAAMAVDAAISAGTGRYNINANGTAQNYFAGPVGIANSTPSYPLDVTGNVRVTASLGIGTTPVGHNVCLLHNRASLHGILVQPSADTGPGSAIYFLNAAGSGVGSINTTASATAYNTASDVRLKHSIEKLVGALGAIQLLNPIKFKWNADDSLGEGFLAHELQQIIPAAVTGEADAVDDDGNVRPQQVDYSKLVVWLTASMQELAQRVEAIESSLGVQE